jgi:hypothetical protein
MFYVAIFIVGLVAGAGPEKTNDVINKALSKGNDIAQSAKSKAIELKDKVKK